jgi:hypothetical protein
MRKLGHGLKAPISNHFTIMKTRTIASVCLLATSLVTLADTFIMKDGTTLEGVVLREEGANYVVEVNVTKSIKDERIIPKADVTKIQREQVDLTAFEAIAKLFPAPDLLTADEYALRIRAFEKFLTDHRGSPKTKEAREIVTNLKAEANEVLAGGVKMNGKIVPPSEYRANAYDLDARIQEAKIRAMIKEGRYLASLRAFLEFSRDFRNTSAYTSILPVITQVINTYMAEVTQTLETYDARVKERSLGLQRMPSADRASTENAISEETANLEAQLKAEKEAKVGWVTTHPFLKASLDETITFGKQELTRISATSTAPAVDGGKVYREALNTIQNKGDSASVSAAISAAKTAMLPAKYIATLEAAGKATGAIK